MIALLAAVPEETELIRHSLQESRLQSIHGLDITSGTLLGTSVCLTHSGIGKAAAAAAATTLLLSCQPRALWLFGCGGAYPGSGLKLGDLALASAEIFGDEGVFSNEQFHDLEKMKLPMRKSPGSFFNHWPVDQDLHDWAQQHLLAHIQTTRTALASGFFVTVSTCTGTMAKALEIKERSGAICENMEGAAVALVCQQLAVPLLEIRGISNQVEDRDTRRWDLPTGMAAAQKAILALLQTGPGQVP